MKASTFPPPKEGVTESRVKPHSEGGCECGILNYKLKN